MPEAEIELTEMYDINVTRQDAVAHPASGFPVLMMKAKAAKAVNAVGGIDEKPDIAGAQRVIAELGKLIQSEAAELSVGAYDEIWDIQQLCEALCLMRCFLGNEQYGDADDGSGLMKSADGLVFKAHRKFSTDERRSLASEGKALPDGSYPIPDEDALHRAAVLARSGHGDVPAAKRLIAKRAKELGVPNPLADDDKAQKDGAPEGAETPEATPQTPAPADGPEAGTEVGKDADLGQTIEKAVAEAMESRDESIKALRDELAVLKATPIPGGPSLTAPAEAQQIRARSAALSKAAYYRDQASKVQDLQLAKFYREKAAEAEQAASA